MHEVLLKGTPLRTSLVTDLTPLTILVFFYREKILSILEYCRPCIPYACIVLKAVFREAPNRTEALLKSQVSKYVHRSTLLRKDGRETNNHQIQGPQLRETRTIDSYSYLQTGIYKNAPRQQETDITLSERMNEAKLNYSLALPDCFLDHT